MKRGDVDVDRSLLWNVVHYRWTDETRVWDTCKSHLHDRVMFWHRVIILACVFFVMCAAQSLVGGYR